MNNFLKSKSATNNVFSESGPRCLVSCKKRVSANDLRWITSCRLWRKKSKRQQHSAQQLNIGVLTLSTRPGGLGCLAGAHPLYVWTALAGALKVKDQALALK